MSSDAPVEVLPPESSDVSPSTSVSVPEPIIGDVTVPSDWGAIRKYAEAARQFGRAQVACQVMAGLGLLELRKQHAPRRGRRAAHAEGKASWDDVVAEHAGIGKDTATIWMKMAEVVRPRLRKMSGAGELFREILRRPIGELTESQQLLLQDAVHKVTDGYSQLEFLRELGICTQPAGHGAKGGDLGGRKPKAGAPEDGAEAKLARDDWAKVFETLDASRANFAALPDHEVEAQIAELDLAIRARRAWLRVPKAERTPDALKQVQALYRSNSRIVRE